ncbi:hypothetical protein [Pelagibius marinus]|uniref:hypothetical protein n=1 Tax=Pelagibius marinus TaxID=2762760 RepID=UPI0018730D25|nr:hypothetical protein [Pelagibius marinus]
MAAAATLLALFPLDGVRAASFCTKPPEAPTVEISISAPEFEVDHSLSRKELERHAAEEYGHARAEGSAVFGLTAGRAHSQLFVHTLTEKRQSGQRCVWPSRLVATLAYDGPIAVYVAREYRRGSCQYKAVLAHEMEHVAVLREALQDYKQKLEEALRQALDRGLFPYTGRDGALLKVRAESYFEAPFREALAAAERERDRRNAALDTPESYRRTRAVCRSW